jgi:tRNA-specific 2-thiouridylase
VAAGEPLYVLEVIPEEARVVIGPKERLLTRTVELADVRFVSGRLPGEPVDVLARIRSRHPEQSALLERTGSAEGASHRLLFDFPVKGPAPGQSAVFFDRTRPEVVMGGGIIRRSSRTGA